MRKLYANFKTKVINKDQADEEIQIVSCPKARILPSLQKFLGTLLLWHGDESLVKALELKSEDDCEQQDLHGDSPEMEEDRAQRTWTRGHREIQYSLLISIWPGTVWVNDKGETIEIPVGSFIIWRGDYRHSGGAYARKNNRLFICVGSIRYPPSDYVAYKKEGQPPILSTVASDRYPLRNRVKL
jgi:hypothetical protein